MRLSSFDKELLNELQGGIPICSHPFAELAARLGTDEETVLERLDVYHKQTAPLKDYYSKQGKLETVIGQEEVSETSFAEFTVEDCSTPN